MINYDNYCTHDLIIQNLIVRMFQFSTFFLLNNLQKKLIIILSIEKVLTKKKKVPTSLYT